MPRVTSKDIERAIFLTAKNKLASKQLTLRERFVLMRMGYKFGLLNFNKAFKYIGVALMAIGAILAVYTRFFVAPLNTGEAALLVYYWKYWMISLGFFCVGGWLYRKGNDNDNS